MKQQINPKVQEIGDKAYQVWAKTKFGILDIATGVGKTFISFRAMAALPKGSVVLFLAETQRREVTLNEELDKYKLWYDIDLRAHCKIAFACYQSAYKWKGTKWDLVVGDEIHSCGPVMTAFFKNNTFKQMMGLSATPDNNSRYQIGNNSFTKKQFLHRFIAPIVFHYTLNQAFKDGIARQSEIFIYKHELDDNIPNIAVTKTFNQTEKQYYKYWDNKFNELVGKEQMEGYLDAMDKKTLENAIAKRANILYKLPSKVSAAKKILSQLTGNTLIFANSIELLLKITPNVVSNKNSKDKNARLINEFNHQRINVLGAFKILQQGENLNVLDNVLIASYYGSKGQSVQRVGRLRRDESVGKIVFMETVNTKESDWLKSILTEFPDYEIKRWK